MIQEGTPAGIGTGGVSLSTQFATNDNASFTDCYKDLYSLRYFHLVNTGLPWCHWPAFLGPYTGWQWYWVQPGSSALQHQTPASALWLDGASSKPRPLSDGPSRLTARTHPERGSCPAPQPANQSLQVGALSAGFEALEYCENPKGGPNSAWKDLSFLIINSLVGRIEYQSIWLSFLAYNSF